MSYKSAKLNITELQDFVLNERNIEKIFKHMKKKDKIKQKEIIQKKEKLDKMELLLPHFKDKLFWCYYILTKGHSSYEMIHKEGFKESVEEKIKLVEEIRLKKDLLKKNKWKKSAIEDDLINNQYISLTTFFCICTIKNKNILYIDGNKFFTLMDELDYSDNLNIIIKKNSEYGIFMGSDEEKKMKLEKCKNNFWQINNLSKPIRAISAYKLKDLQNICKKLNINIYTENKLPKKKSILYQEIKEQL
tara:strand:- start:107 stop:847 length:741 start_codon:yes stop_codon:yes gene_type:complete